MHEVTVEENRWENLVSNKFVDDVDEELLKKYTNQAHDVGRIAIEYTDKRTVLNQLELSEGNNLINAGKVLFADDLIQDIQMAIFATNERLTFNDIQRHHGPVASTTYHFLSIVDGLAIKLFILIPSSKFNLSSMSSVTYV